MKTALLLLFLTLCLALSPAQIFAENTADSVLVAAEGRYGSHIDPDSDSGLYVRSVTFKKTKVTVKGRLLVSTIKLLKKAQKKDAYYYLTCSQKDGKLEEICLAILESGPYLAGPACWIFLQGLSANLPKGELADDDRRG